MSDDDLSAAVEQRRIAVEYALTVADQVGVVSIPDNEWIELADAADDYAAVLSSSAERMGDLCRRNYYGATVEGEDVHQMIFDRLVGPQSFLTDLRAHAEFMTQYAQACRDADRVIREADGQ